MEKLQIKAAVRDLKANVKALRKAGQLPAVLYGHKTKNTALTVVAAEFDKVLKKAGESTIIELITDDGAKHPVLIHDVQIHFLTSLPIHADFYEVNMTEKLKTKIVLEYVGESKAVKAAGGVLMKNLNEIEIECLPTDLPHSILVDISVLEDFSHSIHVKDLSVPKGVTVLSPAEEVVAKVQPPRDVEAELSAPVVEDVASVEGAAEDKPAATEGDDKAKPAKPSKE